MESLCSAAPLQVIDQRMLPPQVSCSSSPPPFWATELLPPLLRLKTQILSCDTGWEMSLVCRHFPGPVLAPSLPPLLQHASTPRPASCTCGWSLHPEAPLQVIDERMVLRRRSGAGGFVSKPSLSNRGREGEPILACACIIGRRKSTPLSISKKPHDHECNPVPVLHQHCVIAPILGNGVLT